MTRARLSLLPFVFRGIRHSFMHSFIVYFLFTLHTPPLLPLSVFSILFRRSKCGHIFFLFGCFPLSLPLPPSRIGSDGQHVFVFEHFVNGVQRHKHVKGKQTQAEQEEEKAHGEEEDGDHVVLLATTN